MKFQRNVGKIFFRLQQASGDEDPTFLPEYIEEIRDSYAVIERSILQSEMG